MDLKKGGKFKYGHRTKFCAGLHEIFGFHGFSLSFLSSVSMSEFLTKY